MFKIKRGKKPNKKIRYKFLLFALIPPAIIFSLPFFYNLVFWGKIFPGVSVSGIYVGGLKPYEAGRILGRKVVPPEKITLMAEGQPFEISLSSLDFSYDFAGSSDTAYQIFRTGNFFYDFTGQVKSLFKGKDLGLKFKINEEKLSNNLSVVAGQVAQEPVYPSLKFISASVDVEVGRPGKDIDIQLLRIKIGQNLALVKNEPIKIPTKVIDPSLSSQEAQRFQRRGEGLIGKNLIISFEETVFTYTYNEPEIFNLLNPDGGYQETAIEALVAKIAVELNKPPQNAVFVFVEDKVQEFTPAKEGLKVEERLLMQQISDSLQVLETSNQQTVTLSVPIIATPPKITTGDVNNLGIKELIGKGTSRFKGSISSRIHNIALAASKFNSVLIAPNETFSFNDALGDVSLYTGYKQAYIIKDGKTILGDGGGVCQVSTTLFRAALNAGLPIVERRAHSYRVSYYEQGFPPGIDATVYAPTTDLKIKNNTGNYILILTKVDKKTSTLVFELYGTSDGRVATTTKPVVKNPVPPPEDLYQDDPTLPAGTIKQIDWKAWGANVYFNYQVKKGEEIIYEKTFYSNYRPWQAVYLRGTGPVD